MLKLGFRLYEQLHRQPSDRGACRLRRHLRLFDNLAGGATINTAVAKVTMTFDDAFIRHSLQLPCLHRRLDLVCRKGRRRESRRHFLPDYDVRPPRLGTQHCKHVLYFRRPFGCGERKVPCRVKVRRGYQRLTWELFVKNLLPRHAGQHCRRFRSGRSRLLVHLCPRRNEGKSRLQAINPQNRFPDFRNRKSGIFVLPRPGIARGIIKCRSALFCRDFFTIIIE